MSRTLVLTATLLCSLLFFCSCNCTGKKMHLKSSTAQLGVDDEVWIKLGEDFVVEANGNPTTGYKWEVCNKEMLEGVILVESNFEPKDSDDEICGGPGTFKLTFNAVKTGDYKLDFVYKRSWEDDENAETKTLAVKVY